MPIHLTTPIVFSWFVYCAVLVSFIGFRQRLSFWFGAILITILVGSWVYIGTVEMISLPFCLLLVGCAYLSTKQHHSRKLALSFYLIFGALALAFALHSIPGLHSSTLFSSSAFGLSGLPFSLRVHFDKALAGLVLLLAFQHKVRWSVTPKDWLSIFLALGLFYTLAIYMGAQTDIKISQLTLVFFLVNLSITCVAEEAFFRLYIQEKLAQGIRHRLAPLIAAFLSALLFTLAHAHFGPHADKRLFLIFIAGLLYALIYMRTKSLSTSIMLHFLINAVHFTFFTYPATFSD